MKNLFYGFILFAFASCSNIPSDVKYDILKDEPNQASQRCDLQVKINKKVSEDILKEIALELRADRKEYNHLWISYYLPDLLPDDAGNGAWAVTNFTPALEVTILGQNIQTPSEQTEQTASFPKYTDVLAMLEDAGDYQKDKGCLVLASKDGEPLHIQVSQQFLNSEPNDNIKEQVKRDIVYVAFQAFAQTDIDQFTITSIPIKRSSFNPNEKSDAKPDQSLQKTVTVDRSTAKKIIDKYLSGSSFQDLYQLDGTLYLPSAKFDRLKFAELQNVFHDLEIGNK